MRRSGKSVGNRYKPRAASEGDTVDSPKLEPRESFRKKMSSIQHDLRNFSPLRAARSKISAVTPGRGAVVKTGADNKAYDDTDHHNSFNVNDNSLNLSTFR